MLFDLFIALSLHLGVPALGFWLYVKLCKDESISKYSLPLFILFFTYGGWLMVILTGLFWYWSGMASLGVVFLIFVAPFILGFQAYKLRPIENPPQHYVIIRRMSLYYPLACIGIVLILLAFE